jgi:hypothetical protein
MNPDEDGQYTLTFDDVSYTIGDTDTHYEGFTTTDTGMDLGVDSFYKGLEDEVEKIELDEVNSRLQRIERVLGIPAELDRNVEMEEKHPHLKQLADEYALAVEQHITLELLTPPDLEEDDLPF